MNKLAYISAITLAVAIFVACTDDPLESGAQYTDGKIHFTASVQNANIISRALDEREFISFTSRHFDDNSNYLVTEVEYGIDGSGLGEKSAVLNDTVNPSQETRGTLITSVEQLATEEGYGQFLVYGYTYDPDKYTSFSDAIGDTRRLISGEKVIWQDPSWVVDGGDTYYWSKEEYHYTFFALAPTKIEGYTTTWQGELLEETEDNELTDTDTDYSQDAGTTQDEATTVNGYEIDDESNWPHLDYVVPNIPKEQVDVLYAQNDVTTKEVGNKVSFDFKHACTAVRLLSLNGDITSKTIKKITFTNVSMAGRFYPGRSRGWMLSTAQDEYTITFGEKDVDAQRSLSDEISDETKYDVLVNRSAETTLESDVNKFVILDGENTLLMLPQTLSENTTISISYEKGGRIATVTASLAETRWTMGTTVTYVISESGNDDSWVLTVGDSDLAFGWGANTNSTKVRSYKVTVKESARARSDSPDKTTVEVPWTATISDKKIGEGTDAKDDDYGWVDFTTQKDEATQTSTQISSGSGSLASDDKETLSFSSVATPAGYIEELENKDITKMRLKGYQQYSTTAAWDLSRDDGSQTAPQTTANCYVIHRAGWYKIPLVYGNAVINGENDKDTYYGTDNNKQDKTVSYRLKPLCEHRGYTMQYSWISEAWQSSAYPQYRINGAKVVWQDAKMVKEIAFSDYNSSGVPTYLSFKIAEADVQPGNIVLAIYDASSSQVLWSWHIWVTPYNFDGIGDNENETAGDITNGIGDFECGNMGGGTSIMSAVPLGYIEEQYTRYPQRSAICTIKQDGGGKTITIKLKQEGHTYRPKSCVYYQWGRKDPFPGYYCSEAGELDEFECYQFTYTKKTIYNGPQINLSNGVISSDVSEIKDEITFSNTSSTGSSSTKFLIGDGISWPSIFYNRSYTNYTDTWYTRDGNYNNTGGPFFNLWGQESNSKSADNRKTIYDPSPRGYKVPTLNAMPKLTYDGSNVMTKVGSGSSGSIIEEYSLFSDYANTSYKSHYDFIDKFGFSFYRNAMTDKGSKNKDINGSTMFLPAFGHLDHSTGKVFNMGAYFYFWSASCEVQKKYESTTVGSNNGAYYCQTGGYLKGNANVSPNSSYEWTSVGMPVWPVRE